MKNRMSDYHLLADATPLTQANKLELGFRQLRKTVERKLGKKEDPAIVKVFFSNTKVIFCRTLVKSGNEDKSPFRNY